MTILECTVQCPRCLFKKEEIMPERGADMIYTCAQCKAELKTPAGECCIYCAYGSVICPPEQEKRNCCSG